MNGEINCNPYDTTKLTQKAQIMVFQIGTCKPDYEKQQIQTIFPAYPRNNWENLLKHDHRIPCKILQKVKKDKAPLQEKKIH